jgi:murein DD-endopeptidase MepM/ murein hydrolase activator NlpD
MRGRLVPFATMLLLFAMLPFLGGSAPQTPTASVVLAAGSPAAVQDAVAAVGQARSELSRSTVTSPPTAALAPVDSAFSTAIGGGLFMFPAISLTPATAEAIAAPIVGRPLFIHPVPGGETSPFGPRIHPLLGRPMFHTGIDLAAACGTPIHAAADGTVIYARVSASWGGRTIIQHSPTVKTAYGHQSKFLVTEGQVVKQGQVIGLSGTTGWSTGCHLHFDVIINDRYVDPAPYLGFAPSATASVPYAVVPHLVLDPGSRMIRTVADGDVPITEASQVSTTPSSTGGRPPSSTTTTKPTTAKPGTATGTPTTSRPSTTTSGPSATTKPSPTTTKPSPTTSAPSPSTTVPPTTTPPPSTTTTAPPTTTTTSDPPPATTSDPPSSSAAAAAPADSTPTATATTTAAAVLKTATEVATAAESATGTSTSEPSASSTTAAEGGA